MIVSHISIGILGGHIEVALARGSLRNAKLDIGKIKILAGMESVSANEQTGI